MTTAITIIREVFTPVSTMGELLLDGVHMAFTIEPPQSSGELVPIGTYNAELEMSPRFQTMTPHLRGVPGYDDNGPHGPIEIHCGNDAANTEGCCLVGTTRSMNWVGNSRAAFDMLVRKLPLNETFTVAYVNDPTD